MIPLQIKQDIQFKLGVYDFNADNFSVKNICCPFHDDKHPSASLHREKGLYCHACARWYRWKDLAEKLGVNWTTRAELDEINAELEQQGIGSFSDTVCGLPSELRNGLISVGLSDMARALDLFYHYGYITGDRIEYVTLDLFTSIVSIVVETYESQFDFKPRTFRKVFEQLQGRGLPKKGEFLRGFFSSYLSLQLKESKKVRKNSKRGRKEGRPAKDAWLWLPKEIIDLAPLAAQLDREIFIDAGPLEAKDYQTGRHYRAAATFQEVKERPGKYARRQIVASTCVSYPTLKPYAELAGLTRTPQPPKKTELKPEEVTALPTDHKDLRLWIAQKKIKSNVFLMDERGTRHEYTQRGAMQAAAMGGGKLYRAEWQASDYQLKEAEC